MKNIVNESQANLHIKTHQPTVHLQQITNQAVMKSLSILKNSQAMNCLVTRRTSRMINYKFN
jgi:hypothetical protein